MKLNRMIGLACLIALSLFLVLLPLAPSAQAQGPTAGTIAFYEKTEPFLGKLSTCPGISLDQAAALAADQDAQYFARFLASTGHAPTLDDWNGSYSDRANKKAQALGCSPIFKETDPIAPAYFPDYANAVRVFQILRAIQE